MTRTPLQLDADAEHVGPRLAHRIDHVGVLVGDIDAAAAHFTSRYGLVKGTDWLDPDGRFRLVYLESGDTTLQLVQPLAEGPLSDHLAERGEGMHHVCFAVDDVDQAIQTLGAPVQSAPYVSGKGGRVCFLSDRAYGVLVELTEPPSS